MTVRATTPGSKLTDLERKVLWHAAQGLTIAATARVMGKSAPAVQDARHRLLAKLRATSLVQAVHLAGMAGIIGAYEGCGDRAAYLRHLRRRETPCPACRAANARNQAARRAAEFKDELNQEAA
ncbi:LuxR C-terminal-related transcriptional regulator [Streptomyces sp. NPDC003314]